MATLREIKGRVSSISNIKKITETMEKISTAKINKNTSRMKSSSAYYHSLIRQVSHIIPYLKEENHEIDHPYIIDHEKIKTSLIFVISSNRGLCAGYNNNVLNLAKKLYNTLKEENKDVKLLTSGKKAVSYFKYAKIDTYKNFLDIDDNVSYEQMATIAEDIGKQYADKEVGEAYVVYTKFFSQANQKPVIEKILPYEIEEEEIEDEVLDEEFQAIYLFEPNINAVLNYILPLALKVKLFNIILETNLSEQTARKIAMKQATDSAGDMIKDLTLQYNRLRQSKITNEIIEIIGAAKALHS